MYNDDRKLIIHLFRQIKQCDNDTCIEYVSESEQVRVLYPLTTHGAPITAKSGLKKHFTNKIN